VRRSLSCVCFCWFFRCLLLFFTSHLYHLVNLAPKTGNGILLDSANLKQYKGLNLLELRDTKSPVIRNDHAGKNGCISDASILNVDISATSEKWFLTLQNICVYTECIHNECTIHLSLPGFELLLLGVIVQ
jgi:hypothetical protein